MCKSKKMDTENVEKKVDRVAKIKELRNHHKPVFDVVGGNPLYCPKMFYTPSGKGEQYVSFFTSELQRGQDIYTEMVDREYNSEDPKRTLYRWDYNMYWESDYEKTTSNPVRYLVPVSELKKVNTFTPRVVTPEVVKEEKMPTLFDETGYNDLEDCSLDDITVRDLVAIIAWQPCSNKKFLNELIRSLPKR